jgi:hypothetical protein
MVTERVLSGQDVPGPELPEQEVLEQMLAQR